MSPDLRNLFFKTLEKNKQSCAVKSSKFEVLSKNLIDNYKDIFNIGNNKKRKKKAKVVWESLSKILQLVPVKLLQNSSNRGSHSFIYDMNIFCEKVTRFLGNLIVCLPDNAEKAELYSEDLLSNVDYNNIVYEPIKTLAKVAANHLTLVRSSNKDHDEWVLPVTNDYFNENKENNILNDLKVLSEGSIVLSRSFARVYK